MDRTVYGLKGSIEIVGRVVVVGREPDPLVSPAEPHLRRDQLMSDLFRGRAPVSEGDDPRQLPVSAWPRTVQIGTHLDQRPRKSCRVCAYALRDFCESDALRYLYGCLEGCHLGWG